MFCMEMNRANWFTYKIEICVSLRKELREKEHFVHMFEEKVTFLLLFLLKVIDFY